MTQDNFTANLRKLTASDGHMICRKDMKPEYPYFSPVVYLGSGDSPDNYREVTIAEAQALTDAAKARDEEEETANETITDFQSDS